MIPRILAPTLHRLAKEYPIVTVTGPRQAGKTTLVKASFPNKPFESLENPSTRRIAVEDPVRFLRGFPDGAILDEVQRVPDLFSYLQTIVDEAGKEGMFILTGSAQFELLNNVSQSLAGRTAIVRLLPFAFEEIPEKERRKCTIDDFLYTGFYPRIYDKDLNPTEALSFYVHTYVERDIRTLLGVKDLFKFEKFLRLCASRVGQVVNLSSLGNETGINHNTASSWLSLLQASYIVFTVHPHFQNFSKRLIKSPKLYFYDTGLAAYLMGIENRSHVASHPLRGQLFENFIVGEMIKKRYNALKDSNLYYFRDNVGNEVDLILDYGDTVLPVEVKSGETFAPDMIKGLNYYGKLNKKLSSSPVLIYGGSRTFDFKETKILSYRDLPETASSNHF